MKKNLLVLGLSLVLVFGIVGCKATDEEVKTTDPVVTENQETTETPVVNGKVKAPDISGEVIEIKEDGKVILIDSKDTTVNGLIWVTISEETGFFESTSENAALAYHNVSRDFEVGNHVEVIIEGPVMESSPMQVTAVAIAVNEKK